MNPKREGKEHCKAITLRSGREVAAVGPPPVIVKELKQLDQSEAEIDTTPKDRDQPEEEIVDKLISKDPTPLIPYTRRLRKSKLD